MLILIMGGIFGAVCAAIASSKGRSPIAWFFIGFFAGLIGLIIILVVDNLKEAQRFRDHAASERRRLREQLQQEKMKTEAFRQHAGLRLDAHDRVLGVDTRAAAPLGAGTSAAPGELSAGSSAPPPLGSSGRGAQWHYEMRGQQKGPVSDSTLRELLATGTLTPTSLVWTQGMSGWIPASDVPELTS